MQSLRALIREHLFLAKALIVLAFFLKAVVPSGYMVSASGDGFMTVTICSESTGGLKQIQVAIPGKAPGSGHADDGKRGEHCGFSGLAKVAVGGADIILLAMAFAFLLVLGRQPVTRLPFRPFSNLRPPLRGPPAAV